LEVGSSVTVFFVRRVAGTALLRRTGDMSEAILPGIIVGVDIDKHTHAAVAITRLGARVEELTIKVSLDGYRELETWAR
jgi:hypothetical protein